MTTDTPPPASDPARAEAPAPGEPTGPSYESRARDALRSAGTSLWEWDPRSDRIGGVGAGVDLLGYGPGDLEPTQQAWNAIIHPDDVADNHAAYLRHASGWAPGYDSEYRARAKDGSWHWIHERGQILERTPQGEPARMVGTLSLIDDRKRVELAASELLNRLQQIARSTPGVLFQYRSLGNDGQFLYVSERSIELIGVPPEQLLQDSAAWWSLIPLDDRKRIAHDGAMAVKSVEPWLTEYRLRHPNTGLRWLRSTATARAEPGGTILWHGYIEDITEARQLEQLRQEAATALAANRAKTEFLSRMSHELRTPLNAVMGFSQLMEMDTREPLSAEQRRRISFVREAGAHLLHMINELLDLTRIESGTLALTLRTLRLGPLLDECLAMLKPQADALRVQLLPVTVLPGFEVVADSTRLRQVLINLLSNAVKYNRPGGTVHLRMQALPGWVALEVHDTGVGIAACDFDALFEPFNRLGHSHSTIEGTGIGLSVTQRLVELMGGNIQVRSTVGTGSTFIVTLPAASG